jgi:flagellar biosynthesis/type III secretory pathway protein FliH
MRFVTSIERKALVKGRQEGRQEGLLQKSRDAVMEVLNARFKRVSKVLRNKIEALSDASQLSTLLKEAVLVESVKAFEELVDQPSPRSSPPVAKLRRPRLLKKVS